jgi:thiol-disulfide isomerase/thioredoxin
MAWVFLAFLWLGVSSGQAAADVPANPVRPIDVSELNRQLIESHFTGLAVVMASWCPPCKKELPILADLYQKYRDDGIRIIGISVDADGPKAMQPLVDKLKIPFPIYWVGMEGAKAYRIAGVPTTMIFNQGQSVATRPGAQSRRQFTKIIRSLLE